MKRHWGISKKWPIQPGVRGGFTVVECVLLIVILGVSIWGILYSAIGASRLGALGRDELKSRSVATALFETLEAMPPTNFDANFDKTVREAIILMGGSGDHLHGYKVVADNIASDGGAHLIQLTLSSPHSKKAPFVLRKSINKFSEKTADDVIDVSDG
ncbi:MAG: hypothetical protein LBP21_07905 [Synergistaceae bacterium]|jgi:hypothetical protein|nr:hypothetical protein [Synergistaceae bacterium]